MSQIKPKNYDEAVKRLEEIAALLESGQPSLEESVALFDESVELAAFCKEQLEAVKSKIRILDGSEDKADD